jgi:D-aminopeptidase
MSARRYRIPVLALTFVAIASVAHGWGHEAHQLITRKACDAMPEPVRAFFMAHRAELVEATLGPYHWRESEDPAHKGEHERHFFDIDYEGFGEYPFSAVPRDYDAAVEKFGDETFDKYGRLPWRIASYLDEVSEAMASGDVDRIVETAAAYSFYVAKPFQPFHCVMNFNGGRTNQRNVDALWEWNLVQEHQQELEVSVAADLSQVGAVDSPIERAFINIMDAYALHFLILNHDRLARDGIDGDLEESEEYLDRMWSMSGELLRRQLSAAATNVASYWLAAWEAAGQPDLPAADGEDVGAAPRARDLGILIGTLPTGELNAITDVPEVRVGHVTVSFGDGPNAARTGVTAIVPRDDVWHHKVPAATFTFNGNGAMTGAHWVNEFGALEVPILLTGTLNVPRVANGVVSWMAKVNPKMGRGDDVVLPFVAECADSYLTDGQARYVTEEHVIEAIESAIRGPVAEGSVGAGTGMKSYSFKAGIGTASRVTRDGYIVGALVLANGGGRQELRVDGVPVGRHITDLRPQSQPPDGSFIVVVATDAPLNSRQLGRLCKRAAVGVTRTGTVGRHGSGDFMVAFSTATDIAHYPDEATYTRTAYADSHMTSLFTATAEAVEESIINAIVAGRTMTGRDGHTMFGMPHDRLRAVMQDHGRLAFAATGE